jgi:hypothetical protein
LTRPWRLLATALFVFVLSCANALLLADDALVWQPDSRGVSDTVRPFFAKYCNACHGTDKQEADLRLDDNSVANDFFDRAARSHWSEIVNVLNSHEMPPESEQQPQPEETAKVVDWIVSQIDKAESLKRENAIVVRRLNREEYRNTIRDLTGVDFDVSGFPLDPAAGGFDNNGSVLTLSPLHIELYLNAAQQILDRAMIEGERPKKTLWRFEVDQGKDDSHRQRLDERNNPIVQGGNNRVEGGMTVMHHLSWDRGINCRDFRVPVAGEYLVRVRAGGRSPDRKAVVDSARPILEKRRQDAMRENPKGERWHNEAFEHDLKHFEIDRNYDYGPPRVKLTVQLGSQPKTIAEFDIAAPVEKPQTYEFVARFTTETAGVFIDYAYDIPPVLENFWFQGHDNFARPEALIDWIEIEGPVFRDLANAPTVDASLVAHDGGWPPPSHRRLIAKAIPSDGDAQKKLAREVIEAFLTKAYRRPVTATEVNEKIALFDAVRAEKASFVEAIKLPLVAALASPNFVFLNEPHFSPKGEANKSGDNQSHKLSNSQIAARLSYLFWSRSPDEELTSLAAKKQLVDPAVVKRQLSRMLDDPRSEGFVRNFADQWLGLREVGANPPAKDLYPQYDRHLETSIVAESRAFFRDVLANDRSVLDLIKSDHVVINERLARFYGIPDVRGDQFQRIKVPSDVERGGVVTQASILTITSNGTRTSPVKRGTWVMKNLLGIDPGLPVANAGDIAPKVPGIDKATVRKRLEIHRTLAQCARCHNKIDPLGFALENFNAAGEFRKQEGFGYKGRIERDDPQIDASSKLLDGTAIDGVTGLRDALLAREDLFLKCLAGKLLTYSLGRELTPGDQPEVQAIVTHCKASGRTIRSMLEAIVTSDAFLSK